MAKRVKEFCSVNVCVAICKSEIRKKKSFLVGDRCTNYPTFA